MCYFLGICTLYQGKPDRAQDNFSFGLTFHNG